MDNILVEYGTIVLAVIGGLFFVLKFIAAKTENKIDDKIVELVESYDVENKVKDIVKNKIEEAKSNKEVEVKETDAK